MYFSVCSGSVITAHTLSLETGREVVTLAHNDVVFGSIFYFLKKWTWTVLERKITEK
jgi:hypothetical protein